MYQPYSPKDPPLYHSAFNHFYYYFNKHKTQPFFFESKIPNKKIVIENLINNGAEKIYFSHSENKNLNNKIYQRELEIILEYKDAVVSFVTAFSLSHSIYDYGTDSQDKDKDKEEEKYYCKILYKQNETLEFIKSLFNYVIEEEKKNIYLLCRFEGELTAQRFDIKLPQKELDIELNYGKKILEKENLLIKNLEDNKSGLVLFNGPPGTGKSTFIKYLSTKTKRKIIYLPSSSASELTDPGFLTFISEYKNSILLLEDAEKVLRNRDLQENTAISNILNLTDGLLGDCLNIFIIATFNTTRDQIDPALLRKGRLTLEHEFDKLPVESCNEIFKRMNIDRETNEPLTLAEIYNEEENYSKKEQKNKIGF